jgi:hypothetical protein
LTRTALDLWSDLERTGMVLRVEAGRLSVTPASLLTDDLRSRIKAVLADLVALVSAAPTPEQQAALDANPTVGVDFTGNVAVVERLPPPDGPDPVPDESLWLIRKMLRARSPKRKTFKPAKPLPPKTLFGGKPNVS